MDDDAEEYEFESLDDDDCDDEFDCGMYPDGQCSKAGSEECDFECPVMAEIHRRFAQARHARHERLERERAQAEDPRQLALPLGGSP